MFGRLLIFSKATFSKSSFRNSIRVSNNLDPDQARRLVNFLQRTSVTTGKKMSSMVMDLTTLFDCFEKLLNISIHMECNFTLTISRSRYEYS